jgi:hypothetical protein
MSDTIEALLIKAWARRTLFHIENIEKLRILARMRVPKFAEV